MENLSDDDFRAYVTDFQSYLHNISDLGPIEPSSLESVDTIASPSDANESSINWSAVSNGQEHRTSGSEVDKQRPDVEEEDDEDRIIAEGCDLDCAREPDLIPSQKHSGWYPDIKIDEDEVLLQEVAAQEPTAGSEEESEHPAEVDTKEESPSGAEECPNEAYNDHDPGVEEMDGHVEEVDETGESGTGDEDHLQFYQKSPADETNATWRYPADNSPYKEVEVFRGQEITDGDFRANEEEEYSRLEVNEQLPQDEVLIDFGESNSGSHEPPSWKDPDLLPDESANSQEEEMQLRTEDDQSVQERNQATAGRLEVESPEEGREEEEEGCDETIAGNEMDVSCSAYEAYPESGHVTTDVPSESATFQASEQALQKDFEEERAYVDEQEATYEEESASLMISSADEENRNTLAGYEEVTETSPDVKQSQNGSQLGRIYPSQVRKTDSFLSGEPPNQNGNAGASSEEVLSPGENGNEEEERELPERGAVKSLLAQWRQIEQQKKKKKPGAAKEKTEHQGHQQLLSSEWSHEQQEDDDEIKTPRSRVRDEILRMRSQSCDPMASRKHNRLSPNDDDVPSVGKRVGRGRSRMEEQDEAEDADLSRSQPSLTKAILAKFENLDLQAANSAIKHKSNKNFKWQVKETTKFCRPGFVPRSGR